MTTISPRLGFLGATLLSTVALGQINVDYRVGATWVNVTQLSAGSDVSINDSNGFTYRVYTLTPTTQSIGNLTIYSSGITSPTLFVGQGREVPSDTVALPIAGAYNIGSISYSGGRPRLQVRVNNNISGEIAFWHIVRIDAGGGILSNITHDPIGAATPPALGYVGAHVIGASTPTTYIVAKRGDIGTISAADSIFANVESTTGSITGRIQAGTVPGENGLIASHNIKALSGRINDVISNRWIYTGSPSYTDNVQIHAQSGIHLVRAHDVMRADIIANANGGNGDVVRVEVLSGNSTGASFYGSIAANRATGEAGGFFPIVCELDFFGTVNLQSDLLRGIYVGQQFDTNSVISVGGSIAPGTIIDVGAQGGNPCFQGQIIVNAGNNNSFWSAGSIVNFCGESLSGIPWYTNLPSTFGGGAIGEAPFNFHAANCTPAHNSATAQGVFPAVVVVRHYGPVFTIGDAPLRVYARATGTLPWIEHTNDYTYAVSTSNNRRNVSISKKTTGLGWAAGHDYRIVPVTSLLDANNNALRCLDVMNKPPVRSYEYTFNITN